MVERKVKKKAIVSRVIIFWALGILVVFFVMYAIAGPNQLLAKTRDAALFFGLGNIPGEERPELKDTVTVRDRDSGEQERVKIEKLVT